MVVARREAGRAVRSAGHRNARSGQLSQGRAIELPFELERLPIERLDSFRRLCLGLELNFVSLARVNGPNTRLGLVPGALPRTHRLGAHLLLLHLP